MCGYANMQIRKEVGKTGNLKDVDWKSKMGVILKHRLPQHDTLFCFIFRTFRLPDFQTISHTKFPTSVLTLLRNLLV